MFDGRVVRVLGTMSGTSLDGVDAAVIETDGELIHGFGPTAYRAYTPAEQGVLRAHLGRWPEDGCKVAQAIVETAHAEVMAGFSDIDLIGFHGQTLAHDPANKRTHQCGDGAVLAGKLGVPVAWDFRTADVAAGGQGAPLAPFFHFALAKWIGATAPVAMVNLGGVGNITWIDPSKEAPEAEGALLAFDTGPANAPMNDLMQQRRGEAYDAEGAIAATGQADLAIVEAFLAAPYFRLDPPKSLDRGAFAALSGAVRDLGDADALATLLEAVVQSTAHALTLCPAQPQRLLVTGGGRKNTALMRRLQAVLPCAVAPVESAGLDGDMIEAQAFGYLAVRVARGLPISAPMTTGVAMPRRGGQMASPPNNRRI
jgi:anhydro-N-acetylmuramic acid kinase